MPHLLWGISAHSHATSLQAELDAWGSTQVLSAAVNSRIFKADLRNRGRTQKENHGDRAARSWLLGGNPTLGESWQMKGEGDPEETHRVC